MGRLMRLISVLRPSVCRETYGGFSVFLQGGYLFSPQKLSCPRLGAEKCWGARVLVVTGGCVLPDLLSDG